MHVPRTTPNAIRALRLAARFHGRRITQTQLARALHTDGPRVSQMEAGYLLPTARELATLCKVLRCDPVELYPRPWLDLLMEEANERHEPAPPPRQKAATRG